MSSSDTQRFEPPVGRSDSYWYDYGYDALELDVDSYRYDDGDFGEHGLSSHSLVPLVDQWDYLTLNAEVHVPEGLFEYVLQDEADPDRETALVVRADCRRTHWRDVVARVDDGIAAGTIPVEIDLKHEQLLGTVELTPVLVRTAPDGSTDVPENESYDPGRMPGLRLADGRSFAVLVDRDPDEVGSFLEVYSRRFEDPQPEDNVFHLDHSSAEDPTYFVNQRVDLLVPLLKSQTPHGSKRWAREVLERLVTHPVWLEVVLWTAADIDEGNTRHEWQEIVVEILVEEFDDLDQFDDVEATKRQLEERISDPERIPDLVHELNRALQQYFDSRSDIENLLEEVM